MRARAYHAPLSTLIPIHLSTRGASLHGASEPHIGTAATSQFPQTRREAHWEATTVPLNHLWRVALREPPTPYIEFRRELRFRLSLYATVRHLLTTPGAYTAIHMERERPPEWKNSIHKMGNRQGKINGKEVVSRQLQVPAFSVSRGRQPVADTLK